MSMNLYEVQEDEEHKIKTRLLEECDFMYEHVFVLIEFLTAYGFEVICNLLRDDGDSLKQAR